MKKMQGPAKVNLPARETDKEFRFESNRREFLAGLTGTAVISAVNGTRAIAQATERPVNVARVAVPSSFILRSENKISALNDGFTPQNSIDHTHGVYAVSDEGPSGSEGPWVQYVWSQPVAINKIEIYWAVDPPRPGALPGSSSLRRMAVPDSYRILYWNGSAFVPVREPKGMGVAADTFNDYDF